MRRITETLPEEILGLLKAPPKPAYPTIVAADLTQYDAFMFGIPTRYGNMPGQWKVKSLVVHLNDLRAATHTTRLQAFWDSTGAVWAAGGLVGKYAGVFVSTGTQGGGQEATIMNTMSTLVHHGLVFVPIGYGDAFPILSSLEEIRGGES